MNTAVVSKTLTKKEKEELIKEILGHRYTRAGNAIPLMNKVIDFVAISDNAFTVTQLVTYTNTLITGSRFVTAVANGASVLSIALMPVSNMISLINAWQTGHRAYAYRAIAYTVTSWVFNMPTPTSSPAVMRNIRSGGLVRSPSIIQEYNKVWQEASRSVINKINSATISAQVPK